MKRTRPATPNLDRMFAVKDKSAIVQDFIDWYCDEYLGGGHPYSLHADSGDCQREAVMAAYFGIDLRQAEKERMTLLQDIREDHKVEASIQRKAAMG